MTLTFREATREDVPAIVGLLREDALGATREDGDEAEYLDAFDRVAADPDNTILVGEVDGRVVACCQLILIPGLSLRAATRAQIEGVRVVASERGKGIGTALLAEAERRARERGATLMQFTSNSTRDRARAFYERLGYVASHTGFKKSL